MTLENNMSASKTSEEFALKEFARFIEAFEIEDDPKRMSEAQLKLFEQRRWVIVKSIMKGRCTVSSAGVITMNVVDKTVGDNGQLVFNEPMGDTIISVNMAQIGHKEPVFLAGMCRSHESTFSRLNNRELDVGMAIVGYFL